LIGGIGYLTGLVFAAILDMPAGAMIVYSLTLTAVIIGWMLTKREGSKSQTP
jgi:ABC-type Mn2+/Zn2+ transport system permease subunit